MNEDTFDSHYYKRNKFFLVVLGEWPFQNRKGAIVRRFLVTIFLSSIVVTQGAVLIKENHNRSLVLEVAGLLVLATSSTIIRYLNCWINMNKLGDILNYIKNDWKTCKNDAEIQIMQKYAEQSRLFSFFFTVYVYGCLMVTIIVPLVPKVLDLGKSRNESSKNIFLFPGEYFVDPDEYFYPITLHVDSGTFLLLTIIVAQDSLFLMLTHHACSLFAIVGLMLENLKDEGMNGEIETLLIPKGRCQNQLTSCIQKHKKALQFVELLESYYSAAFMALFVIALPGLSLFMTKMVQSPESNEFMKIGTYVVGTLIDWLLYNYNGQRIIDHSIGVCKNIKWCDLPVKIQKMLIMMVVRSAKPSMLSASGTIMLSCETYAMMVKTSVSYYTVLASF